MTEAGAESVEVKSRAEWRRWLGKHHRREQGLWVVFYKRHVPEHHVSYDALVEEALCFGWVDSKGRAVDDRRSMMWFAPRRPGSGWARTNKARVERLIAAGLMAPAGLGKIDEARRDGSWSLLDDVEDMIEPPELTAALARSPSARRNYDGFPPSARKGILLWIGSAKRPETRARRIEETVRLAARNLRANDPRPQQTKRPAGAIAPPGRKSKQD